MMERGSGLILRFDDLVRCFRVLVDDTCEKEFLKYVSIHENARLKFVESANECKRLKTALDSANKNIAVLDNKLSTARKLMDEEKQSRKRVEVERDALADQLEEVRRILLNDPRYGKLPDETRERLSFLNKSLTVGSSRRNLNERLLAVEESDSTASLLSDFSFSRSGDDLDDSVSVRSIRKSRRSFFADENTDTIKRKKSIHKPEPCTPIMTRSMKTATYTPTAPAAEALDSLSDEPGRDEKKQNFRTPIIERINAQMHSFVTHNTLLRQTCQYCTKKMGFSRTMWKCKGCMAIAHTECIDKVPLPCILMGTPKKGISNTISAYAPSVPPMIPANVIHCVNEIEQRGLTELGIYKISGSEAGVHHLKEKFLRGRGAPNLSDENIHDVCSYLKEFFRGLHDTLIPKSEWNTFARAITDIDKKNKLYHAISLLPQPNRDTLAYIILHFQRVASSRDCKVSLAGLAQTFGPIIVGYSDNEQTSALKEAQTAIAIMEELLTLPPEYWCSLISFVSLGILKTPNTIHSTPSVESLVKKSSYLFTPGGRRRFFNTPPQKQ